MNNGKAENTNTILYVYIKQDRSSYHQSSSEHSNNVTNIKCIKTYPNDTLDYLFNYISFGKKLMSLRF